MVALRVFATVGYKIKGSQEKIKLLQGVNIARTGIHGYNYCLNGQIR